MKKVLLGTTAIVAAGMVTALATPADAQVQVQVGGYMEQWIGYTSVDDAGDDNANTGVTAQDPSGFDQKSDSEISFSGSTTLDNGITFGINVQLEGNTNTGDQIDESYLIVRGSFGEINLGSENSAMYKMHYAPSDYGIGINSGDQIDWVTGSTSSSSVNSWGYFRGTAGSTYVEAGRANDSEKITYYTPRFAGFQLGASYSPDTRQDNNTTPDRDADVADGILFGANFVSQLGGADIAVSGGWGQFTNNATGGKDPTAWNAGITVGFGGFSAGASYAHDERSGSPTLLDGTATSGNIDGDAFNVGIAYASGPFGVSLTYFKAKLDLKDSGLATQPDFDHNAIHLSGKYALGPGVTAAATLGHTKFEDSSNFEQKGTYFVAGIKLSF